MKLRENFRFEFAYQLRRVSTWLYFAVMLAVVVFSLIAGNYLSGARNGDYLLNAPFIIMEITVVCSLLWPLAAAAVAGEAAARDVETRMHPLTYTVTASKAEYLGGRFLAALVLNALILLAVPAGILLAVHSPGVEAEILGPFRPAAYLSAYLFIALPNAFFITAIQFSFAALSRRAIASYLGGILLAVAAFVVPEVVAGQSGLRALGKLLDPFGVAILDDLSVAWTPIEKNTRLIGLDGTLLWNRLLWTGIALVTLAFTCFRFRLRHHTATTWWSRIMRRSGAHAPAPAGTGSVRSTSISVTQVRRTFGFATHTRQTLAIAWTSFRKILTSWSGLVLLTVVAILAVLSVLEGMHFMGVPLLPRADYVLHNLIFPDVPPAWFIIPLLIVFWSGQLVWRERGAGVSEIVDAAPAPEWVLFLGKFLGLGLVLVACMAVRMTAVMLVQVGMGYHEFEIRPYLTILFGIQLADYLLLALLALVVHVVVNQKQVGHLVTVVACVLMVFASATRSGPRLLMYGSDPGWAYTDMRGFGASLGPWLWFKLYWTAWALLLGVAATLLWVRGKEGGLGARLRMARGRFTRPTARAAGAAAGLILIVGGFIFYNTNVLNENATASDRMERRVEYERRYGQYRDIPLPRLTGTSLHVEIYPGQRKAEIRGTYLLVNGNAAVIDSIHLATASEVETAVSLDRPAALVLADEVLGHRIYALNTPLQPGDALRLGFDVRFGPRGFRNDGGQPVDASVAANGTFFTNQDWLPAIGYQANRELSDAGDRRALGLAPRPAIPSPYDVAARQDSTGKEPIAFEAVVGTDEGQIAVAPGALRRTWMEGGRRYFRYSTDAPIGNEYALFSADYAVHEGEWNDPSAGSGQVVAIRIFHHPGHTANLDRMLQSVRASLNHYTKLFGPYPYRHISLVERPGHGMGMHAEAGMITFQEGFSLLNPESGPQGLDLPFYVVAHEAAHQWWGSGLAARVEGAGLLSESLASYAGYQVVEKTYGHEHLRRLLGRLRMTDDIPHSRAAVPLLRAADSYAAYRKGPFAMYTLSEYIGEERVNKALRRLLAKHRSGAPPLLTSLDLYRELQAVTPDSLQYLLHDLFEANTFWELETEGATAEETDAGAWQVTLDVRARKVVVDEAGVETEVPMDDWVEIGVFAPAEEGKDSGEPLYVQMHRIRPGEQTITVTVPRKPARAGIDPDNLLIDLETDDNIRSVKVKN